MASVESQLKKLAKEKGVDINRLRSTYAMERLVARISMNPKINDRLVYKGGYVLMKTTGSDRLTRDIDAVVDSISTEHAANLILNALTIDLKDEIYFFDSQQEDISTAGEYAGIRIDCAFTISDPNPKKIHKLSRIHFDIGFGPYLPDDRIVSTMPILLENTSSVSWSILPLEYIFAEKIHAMVDLGSRNSRAKDLYDLCYISESVEDVETLQTAIQRVFEDRSTEIPESFSSFVEHLNISILRSSWRSVNLAQDVANFDEYLEKFILFLKKNHL